MRRRFAATQMSSNDRQRRARKPPAAHSGAFADQAASDADQAASDADQAASDADQAASDAEHDVHAAREPQWQQQSSDETRIGAGDEARRSGTLARQKATRRRGETNRVRARQLAGQLRRKPIAASDVQALETVQRAITERRFTLLAQPIIELATGSTVRHELLIRMVGEDGALLMPSEFIPVAEQFNLIAQIDRWVLGRAIEFARSGHSSQVNISGGTLAEPGFGELVQRELEMAGVDPELIVFEVTETALIGNEALAVEFFERVRALGCSIAIDDFGSGYGGFRYLKLFPVDYLKIDREFISDVAVNRDSRKVAQAIVQLAKDFKLRTVAEGVEDAETVRHLRSLEIRYGQGYFFGHPAPALELLTKDSAAPVFET